MSGNLVGSGLNSNAISILIDDASATTTYIGKAPIGTATSAAKWQIQKISSSGTVTTIAWAAGSNHFGQIWDNRASLSYS